MRRWHAERHIMLRRWRYEIANHGGHAGYRVGDSHIFWSVKHAQHVMSWHGDSWLQAPIPPVICEDSCHCFAGPGFFRKRKPFDCGNPHCGLCHYEKYMPKARANKKREAIQYELDAE